MKMDKLDFLLYKNYFSLTESFGLVTKLPFVMNVVPFSLSNHQMVSYV